MNAPLEYLAGILDTHGAIIMRTDKGYTFPIVRIGGRKEMLQLFADQFGGSVTCVPSRPNWMWTKQGIEAKRVLTQMRPYMRLRLEEVDVCLAWIARNPKKAAGPASREQKKRMTRDAAPAAIVWPGVHL